MSRRRMETAIIILSGTQLAVLKSSALFGSSRGFRVGFPPQNSRGRKQEIFIHNDFSVRNIYYTILTTMSKTVKLHTITVLMGKIQP